jgi:hypothetical protein
MKILSAVLELLHGDGETNRVKMICVILQLSVPNSRKYKASRQCLGRVVKKSRVNRFGKGWKLLLSHVKVDYLFL